LLKEYQWCNFQTYKNKRLEFLNGFSYCQSSPELKDFVSSYRPKIGIYAGSFNPFHCGHMNILEQAEKIFAKVIIATGLNPSKSQEKVGWSIREVLPFHEIVEYNTLLPEYLKTLDYADITLIRGLRNGYDLQYEMNQLRFLEDYQCQLPVTYFICEKEFMHISSSDIRGLAKFEYNNIDKYMPKKYKYSTDAISISNL
jgi:pantetheine-phosphate adenylyltransferase